MNDLSKILMDVKTAWVSAIGTASSGIATILDKIPADIGKLATLVGIVFSLVLIYAHIRRLLMDIKTRQLDDQLKQLKIEAAIKEAARNQSDG